MNRTASRQTQASQSTGDPAGHNLSQTQQQQQWGEEGSESGTSASGWHTQGYPPWAGKDWTSRNWHVRRRYFFLRFIGFFALIMVLLTGGMAFLSYHVTRHFGGDGQTASVVWIGGCGLAAAFPLVALALVTRVFRSYAMPLADVMTAADRVADGDLGVRLETKGSRDFKQLATSFNRMTTELERTDQQRRNLTADVAHELRTPLHIIQGNLEGILDGVYEPTPAQIEATLEETRQLARLVEDLRTLSLAESGELPLQREPVDLMELLADVVTSFTPQAEAKGIQVTLDEDTGIHRLFVDGDPGRLDQVLSNLVTNASRHTPVGGTVQLYAACHADTVIITVRDTGEGIADADLPYVFDRFWKGDRARTHSEGAGSGLGLAIARQLIEAHGGQITVDSTVGQGTTFSIRLPL